MKITKAAEPVPVPGTQVLFAGLAARLGRVTPAIAARIRAEIPGYSALASDAHAADVDRQIRDAVGGLVSGSGPTASAIEHARGMGHRRAAAGITLPDVIEAYHIAYREIWTELLGDARESAAAARQRPRLCGQPAVAVDSPPERGRGRGARGGDPGTPRRPPRARARTDGPANRPVPRRRRDRGRARVPGGRRVHGRVRGRARPARQPTAWRRHCTRWAGESPARITKVALSSSLRA